MKCLGILDEDLIEKFILSSGKGGQKVNKTASCVYLKHIPTGIEIKCGRERSRELNRFFARRELCDRLEHTAEKRADKVRKQKKRRRRRNIASKEKS
jgi:peptide chain release factor